MKLKDIFITKTKEQRLYQVDCPVIGLTGGIATGKSTISKLFENEGIPVICADRLVKSIYKEQETIDFIKKNFSEAVDDNLINFKKLREIAFTKISNREQLESFIYSKLPHAFNSEYSKLNSPEILIYDVPLLFEKKMEDKFDLTICVYANKEIQIERIVKRDQSNAQLAEKILQSQLPIDEKKELSDFCIRNNKTIENLETEFEALISLLFES